ncbi:hypothetical protein Mal52_48510 [Symmachiella dynata]|uniref:SHOCT domain-containing protein n=1 Tax=Symmachiella dynata TaxID=2527995 RepID=A0A517ZV22_9PLAN|nr:SHOCT domain-containing protein [Symmachiella dynata]QDU46332.1 hypothetical protein Mal52_48510 [Symmachiella dynata]
MRPALLCGALLLLNLLIGCLALTIGEKTTVVPSVGEQLTHLKAAFDSGALTDAEYTSQKMALLNKSTELNESPTQLATFETESAE